MFNTWKLNKYLRYYSVFFNWINIIRKSNSFGENAINVRERIFLKRLKCFYFIVIMLHISTQRKNIFHDENFRVDLYDMLNIGFNKNIIFVMAQINLRQLL